MEQRYGIPDKIIAYLTLISGLVISAVAVWYSVAGLVSIFAASATSIIIMGVALEVSKLIATVWLKWNWQRAPFLIKTYLVSAIIVLMLITSMGIFGYLSRAHLDQNIVSGDVQSRIALIDEKIKIERENISNAQSLIKQMDDVVNGIIATGDREITLRDGSTRMQSAAERSLQVRRSQAKDRSALISQIEDSQARIVKLQEESAPIRAEMRKVEAEVGPIKYIAKLIYADNPDQNLLEKAVTWVIIIIVLVFDPLAVVLLLSSQYSFQWFKQEEERKNELVQDDTSVDDKRSEEGTTERGSVNEGSTEQLQPDPELPSGDDIAEEANRKIAEIEPEITEIDLPIKEFDFTEHAKSHIIEPQESVPDIIDDVGVDAWNKMLSEAEKAVDEEKQKMRQWKEEHPDATIKDERLKKEVGVTDKLPWEEVEDRIKPNLTEVIEPESKKKMTYMIKDHNRQIKKTRD